MTDNGVFSAIITINIGATSLIAAFLTASLYIYKEKISKLLIELDSNIEKNGYLLFQHPILKKDQ